MSGAIGRRIAIAGLSAIAVLFVAAWLEIEETFSVFTHAVVQLWLIAASFTGGYGAGGARRWTEPRELDVRNEPAPSRRLARTSLLWFRQRALMFVPLLIVAYGIGHLMIDGPVYSNRVIPD